MTHARAERLEARCLLALISPDVTWGQDGYADTAVPDTDGHLVGLSGAHGILVTSTDYSVRDGYAFTVDRTVDGRPDPTFRPIRSTEDDTAAVDRQGRPLVLFAGNNGRFSVTRYTHAGRPDTSFSGTGTAAFYPTGRKNKDNAGRVLSVAAGPDDSVFVFSSVTNYGGESALRVPDYYVTKLTPAGGRDSGFGRGGTLKLPDDFDSQYASDGWAGVDSKGRVIVALLTPHQFDARRFTADGVADTAWGDAGALFGLNVETGGVAIDAQDRLVLADQYGDAGDAAANSRLLRYTARGRSDRTFDTGGVVRPVAVDPDKGYGHYRVVVLGDGTVAAQLGRYVVHVHDDGTLTDDGLLEARGNFTLTGAAADDALLADANAQAPLYHAGVARLAVTPAAALGTSGTLYLNGGDSADTFRLAKTGVADLTVTANGRTQNFGAAVKAVIADLGEGDNVYVDDYLAATADLPSTIAAGAGDDSIVTGAGDDSITTGDGNDTVSAGAGDDDVTVGDGQSQVDGGSGGAAISAGYGDDNVVTVTGSGAATDAYTFHAGGGRSNVSFTGGTMTVDVQFTTATVVDLHNSGPATVYGTDGDDSITTGDGADLIVPGYGRDTVHSGAGDDTVGGEDSVDTHNRLADDFYDLGPGNDVARDGYGDNTVLGGDGNDSIRTAGGNDSLSGGLGRDTIRGGDGADTIDGGGSGDRLFGQDGDDSLLGSGGSDLLVGGLGDDTLRGNAGDDLLLAGLPNAARVPAARNVLDGGSGVDSGQIESDDDVVGVESLIATVT